MTIPPAKKEQLLMIAKVLNNERRSMILEYIYRCNMATQEVLVRVLKLLPGTVSKDVKVLLGSNLVLREKIGKRWVYQPNHRVMNQISKIV